MGESLLLLDTVSIKKYIFASKLLKEIRGASSLLDTYNRFRMEEIVNTETSGDYKKIYACGGSGLFIIPSVRAEAIKNKINRIYAEIGVEIIIAHIPYAVGTDDFSETLSLLTFKAEEERYQSGHNKITLTHPLFRDCDADKREYSSKRENDDLVSYSIERKRQENRKIKEDLKQKKITIQTLWGRLNQNLVQMEYPDIAHLEFPESFERIADFDPGGYIALIYADGNEMGKAVKSIKSIEAMKSFSDTVDSAIYHAAAKAIARYLRINEIESTKVLPFDILLIGGDDLVMVVPACYGVGIARTLAEEFRNFTETEFKNSHIETDSKNLSISVGLSFSKPNYPIFHLLNTTENLLASSKKERVLRLRENKSECNMINYMLIQHSGLMDCETFKKYNFTEKVNDATYFRTCRPFSFDELMELIEIARELKKVSFSPGKLQILADASFKSYYDAIFRTLFVLTRCKSRKNGEAGERKALENLLNFPVKTGGVKFRYENGSLFCSAEINKKPVYKTAILDLLDMYNFIEQPEVKNGEG